MSETAAGPAAEQARAVVFAVCLALALVAGSSPRVVGDGAEYVALALNLSGLHGPAIGADRLEPLRAAVSEHEPGLERWDIRKATVAGPDDRRDFLHFWFYSLIAVPFVWVTSALGAHPVHAFTALNVTLLALALWACLPRIGAAAALLIFCGPIVWWIDKPHTEVFTVSLLSLAFVLLRERPWWALVAAGAAATQNLPIAGVVVAAVPLCLLADRRLLRTAKFWYGAAAGCGLALLAPVYYWSRYGTPSLLLRTTRNVAPSVAEWSAVVGDPVIGLLANFPAIVVVAVVAVLLLILRRPRALLSIDLAVAVIAATGFLLSFAQADNIHHGGTPSMSRYALWLVPLVIPILRGATLIESRAWSAGLWTAAIVSAVGSVFVFHPKVAENAREPTSLATFLWTRHPGWNNPLPEVFVESLLHVEERWYPVATPGCEKVLLHDRGDGISWPMPCLPAPLPAWCVSPETLCYANLTPSGRYRFARTAMPRGPRFRLRRDAAWPAGSEARVRALFTEWESWTLQLTQSATLREEGGVGHVWVYEGTDRFLFVVVRPRDGAFLKLRLPGPMTGRLVNVQAQDAGAEVRFDGAPYDPWTVPIPGGPEVVVLALKAMSPD